jgi:7-keto-8-aminopelargonate synthetase-like enzyme
LIDLLVNRARSFIFTTGLPPAAAAAARAAIAVTQREPELRQGLLARSRALGEGLRSAGLRVPHLDSQILPILIGSAENAIEVATRVLERGAYVAAIRPPTVPAGTSRLRLSMMATHTREDVEIVSRALVDGVRAVRAP